MQCACGCVSLFCDKRQREGERDVGVRERRYHDSESNRLITIRSSEMMERFTIHTVCVYLSVSKKEERTVSPSLSRPFYQLLPLSSIKEKERKLLLVEHCLVCCVMNPRTHTHTHKHFLLEATAAKKRTRFSMKEREMRARGAHVCTAPAANVGENKKERENSVLRSDWRLFSFVF